MIVFLNTRDFQNTVRGFVRSYGRAMAGTIAARSYERVMAQSRLRRGAYVFGDIERLPSDDAERAADLWQRLADLGGCRLLNHPTRSMRRYELLRTLRERGDNRFDVYRASEQRVPRSFPVFLRGENDHGGSRTPLLHDPGELARALADLDAAGASRDQTLVTEFCDTAGPDGVYRKYAAFIVGDRIIPRHVFFSDDWMVKFSSRFDPRLLEEERAYLEDNPHAEALRTVFATARIDYGRVDYAVAGGALQVWEINTNPQTVSFRHAGGPARKRVQTRFAEQFGDALRALE
jgi:hypothetical protein